MTILQTAPTKPKTKNVPKTESVNENRKREFLEQFSALGKRLEEYRKKNGIPEEPFTMDEIVAEVKKVRAEMYAKGQNY
ncbi:MAG: hypothetical protein LBL62_12845 [Planctomycetaceae bacterium]|jgi:hypothetical protein|nr:hypothetical protein [Planctomycetaceae bacterium]